MDELDEGGHFAWAAILPARTPWPSSSPHTGQSARLQVPRLLLRWPALPAALKRAHPRFWRPTPSPAPLHCKRAVTPSGRRRAGHRVSARVRCGSRGGRASGGVRPLRSRQGRARSHPHKQQSRAGSCRESPRGAPLSLPPGTSPSGAAGRLSRPFLPMRGPLPWPWGREPLAECLRPACVPLAPGRLQWPVRIRDAAGGPTSRPRRPSVAHAQGRRWVFLPAHFRSRLSCGTGGSLRTLADPCPSLNAPRRRSVDSYSSPGTGRTGSCYISRHRQGNAGGRTDGPSRQV